MPSRRPSLEQLLTTHQDDLQKLIKTPRKQLGADADAARDGINAIYELIGKEAPLQMEQIGTFVQQLGIVLPPARLMELFSFFAVEDAKFPSELDPTGKKAETMTPAPARVLRSRSRRRRRKRRKRSKEADFTPR